MRSTYCIACSTEYPVRKEDGPFKMLSCVRCIGGKEARECTRCGTRFYGRPGDSCRVCIEDALSEMGIYTEFKGVRI